MTLGTYVLLYSLGFINQILRFLVLFLIFRWLDFSKFGLTYYIRQFFIWRFSIFWFFFNYYLNFELRLSVQWLFIKLNFGLLNLWSFLMEKFHFNLFLSTIFVHLNYLTIDPIFRRLLLHHFYRGLFNKRRLFNYFIFSGGRYVIVDYYITFRLIMFRIMFNKYLFFDVIFLLFNFIIQRVSVLLNRKFLIIIHFYL